MFPGDGFISKLDSAGNITELKFIAEELSDTHAEIMQKIVQLAENFDLDGIAELAAKLKQQSVEKASAGTILR